MSPQHEPLEAAYEMLNDKGIKYRVEKTNGNQYKLFIEGSPRIVLISGTGSDHRIIKNVKSDVKRSIALIKNLNMKG